MRSCTSLKKTTCKTTGVALKSDMEKAYDRLEWDYIQKCLQLHGFHPTWIKWVMECISSVSYSLLINGEPSGLIKPSRGIRQGDPLSPYIFLLCMEALTNSLSIASRNPKGGIGIKICLRSERLPCLMFADDCLLFCKAETAACWHLKNILDTFCDTLGQLINYHKSTLTFSKNAKIAYR